MLFARVVDTSRAVAATRSRTAKTRLLADLLLDAVSDGPGAVELVTSLLSGVVPHGPLGVGYRTLVRDGPIAVGDPLGLR